MFAGIARRYDLGNDVLSFGAHRLWKRRLVAMTTPGEGGAVLDLATGTGDIAILYAETVGIRGSVVGIDFCADMIEQAHRRAANSHPMLTFQVADATQLPFDSNTFDVTSISFGIRNVDDPSVALREMARVTRPGGSVAILETGQPHGVWGLLYRLYSTTILPVVGGILSGSFRAYSYLNRTAAAFPYGESFAHLMRRAGLVSITSEPLFGGIAYLYRAAVPIPSSDHASHGDVPGKVKT